MLVVAFDCGAPPNGVIVNDFGDAGSGYCASTCTLRDALMRARDATADVLEAYTLADAAVSGAPEPIATAL